MVALVDDIKVSTVGKAIQAYQRLIAKTAPYDGIHASFPVSAFAVQSNNKCYVCVG